jgi:hypothetical protein
MDGGNSTGTITATVSESVSFHNGNAGFAVFSATGAAPTTFSLFHSVSSNNGVGMLANVTGATLRITQSMVTGNSKGWSLSGGGVIASYGDNAIDGNGSNTGSLTPISKQ